jgi:hypothetical protein
MIYNELLDMFRHASRTNSHHYAALAEINGLARQGISDAEFRDGVIDILKSFYTVQDELDEGGEQS